MANIEALDINLSEKQIQYLESIIPFDIGFPGAMFGNGTANNALLNSAANFEKMPLLQPIRPLKN